MATVVKILRRPEYIFISICVAIVLLMFAAWLPNLHLVNKTIASETLTLRQKTDLLTALLGSLETNFTPLSRTLTVISAALTGIQTSLLIYYVRQTLRIQTEMGVSFIGIITSLFGIGCASCGSVLLTSMIGLGTATAVISILPFRGQEFGFLGIAILLSAIAFTVKKINQPLKCRI